MAVFLKNKGLNLILFFAVLFPACEEDDKKNNNNAGPSLVYGSFIDARDNQEYQTIEIGVQVWMAENLNWAGKGLCYDEDSLNCETYGRLYTPLEILNNELPVDTDEEIGIQGICPDGWHLPSWKEWNKLIVFLGADSTEVATIIGGYKGVNEFVGNKLKANKEWSFPSGRQFANESGFSALPFGYITRNASNVLESRNLGGDALFYTSSYTDSTMTSLLIRTLKDDVSGNSELGIRSGSLTIDNDWYTGCRCVKD